MAIPSWLSVTAADVQTDSRLTADMAKAGYSDSDFQAEIARRGMEWSNVIIGRLRRAAVTAGLSTAFDDDLSTVLTDDQQATANLALKLFVISVLWQNLPGSDSQYANQANDTGLSGTTGTTTNISARLTSGEGLLAELEKELRVQGELATDSGVTDNGSAVSTRMVRDDGYAQCPVSGNRFLRQ